MSSEVRSVGVSLEDRGLVGPCNEHREDVGDAVVRMGWPVGRVLCAEAWRPSIYDGRCRPPPAVYPRTRAGRPRSCARPGPEGSGLLDLAPGGVYRAGRVAPVAGGLLHHRFTLTSRRQAQPSGGRRSVLCGTVPRVSPGGRYPPPRPVEPGPSSAPHSREHGDAVARPAHPQGQDRAGGAGDVIRMVEGDALSV